MNDRLKRTLITLVGFTLAGVAALPQVPTELKAALLWLSGLALGKEHLPQSVTK